MNAPWTEDTVQGVLAANRLRMGDAAFLTLVQSDGSEQSLSYDTLMTRAECWAGNLSTAGIRQGDRVVVIHRHGLDLYAAYIGAILMGAVPSMFAHPSPKLSEAVYFETIEALLAGSKARALVTCTEVAEKLMPLVHRLPTFETLLTDGDIDPSVTAFETPAVAPDDPAFLQYSSGTTGLKKGVVISHRALLWQIETYGNAIEAGTRDTIISWLPLYHDMGLISCLFLPLIRRCRLVAMSPFDWVRRPGMWPEAVTRHRGTLSWLPNFAYLFMARNVPEGAFDLSSLRGVVNCSEPVTQQAHEAFIDRFAAQGLTTDALAASYAMAETVFAVTSGGFDDPLRTIEHDGRVIVSSGRILPDTDVRILAEDGRDLPDGETGEIEIAAPCLFSGYDNNRDATQAALNDNRYRSGDLGFLQDGHLFVTGRKRDLIIIGGKNIYPHDIEALTETISGVLPGRSVALGKRDEGSGTEQLIVLAESDAPAAGHAALIDAIRSAIAGATEVNPNDIRIVPPRWLRKSTSGKIARAANLERYLEELSSAASPDLAPAIGPSGLRERVRRLVIDQVLDGQRVDDDTSLIRAGRIDSFSIVNLILTIERAFGLSLPESIVSRTDCLDTIQAIAETVERLQAGITDEDADTDFDLADVPMVSDTPVALPTGRAGFWTWYYRLTFRRHGIRYGKGLRVLGPILLRLDGNARNMRFGDGVTIMPGADLKIRENGKLTVGDGCAIDTMARLVAANDAEIRLGDRSQIAFASIINAGENVTIGRDTATAGHCTIIASEHLYTGPEPIMSQGYRHEPVLIGADVWLASNVLVTPGSKIGNGAVISARSTVAGTIRPYALAAGAPARIIGSRLKGGPQD
ncbi:AMP-binding protein [Minwuia sp.]|uniref:AMP-binding protein n=1 Tax=Minwuia sp. TaxID=2493630 RepID=UPI003A9217E5